MTPDQLARVLSAGEQHVHDPHTRSAINAMIGECHRIEDEQAVRLIEAPVQADFITPQGSDYVVTRADRSVHVAFIDLEHAENFEDWMRSGDWAEFLRWQRASRDTAPQPMLDDAAAYGSRVEQFGTDEARYTPPQGSDYVPGEVRYKGHSVPSDLKQPAMDAGHPPEVYARGLPDEPMEPAQIKPDYRDGYMHTPAEHHQFVEHPTDSYFCRDCGNSHFHEIHDVLEIK